MPIRGLHAGERSGRAREARSYAQGRRAYLSAALGKPARVSCLQADVKHLRRCGLALTACAPLLACALEPSVTRAQGPAATPAASGLRASSSCVPCHSSAPGAGALRDARGRAIGPFDLWQSAMMANAARDPLWRAVLSAEVAALPSRQVEIETKCLSCHAPLEHRRGLDDHGTGTLVHVLECDSEPGARARDGVSCAICHGIRPEGLGSEASFSAHFELDGGRLFGPHEAPFAMPMRHFTGLTPSFGPHVLESALCGSCHTLETEALDAQGAGTGVRFLEQAPYLEWRNSAFSDEGAAPGPRAASCQDCHVPVRDADGLPIETRIARNPGGRNFPPLRARSPFGRHLFVGANTLVPALLRDHPEELGAQAPTGAFEATLHAAREQLRERSARVAVEDVSAADGRLAFSVAVTNLAGHKLPSAHPTRRAWLRVLVRDAEGRIVFASGATDAAGRIVGADGQPLPSELAGGPVAPHRDVVRAPDQVATYEGVMADTDGRPTYTLLRGARWLVDDRLLPAGWSPDHPEAQRTAPVAIGADADFVGGGDRVRYELALDAGGELTIEAALLHQTLSARWAGELFEHATPEIERFRALYEAHDRTPEVLASNTASVTSFLFPAPTGVRAGAAPEAEKK